MTAAQRKRENRWLAAYFLLATVGAGLVVAHSKAGEPAFAVKQAIAAVVSA